MTAIFQLFIENPIIKPKYMHTHVVSGHQLNLIVLVNKYMDSAIFLFLGVELLSHYRYHLKCLYLACNRI